MKGTRKSFLSLDLFSLTFKNSFLTVLGGGGDRPHRPRGSATVWTRYGGAATTQSRVLSSRNVYSDCECRCFDTCTRDAIVVFCPTVKR